MAITTADTAAVTGSGSANAKQFQAIFNRVIISRVTWEDDTVAAGLACAGVYTGITGARQGDFVLVAPISDLGDDLSFSAQVTADDEVTVIVQDQTAATNTSAATVGNLNLIVLGVDAALFNNAGTD